MTKGIIMRSYTARVAWNMAVIFCLLAVGQLPAQDQATNGIRTITVFKENIINFTPEDSTKYDADSIVCRDRGRVITRTVDLPDVAAPVRITAHVVLAPIPKDELEVYDRWDRAGNIRLEIPGRPDVELVKFVTAYGGRTEYEVDLSYLAPLLYGRRLFKGFVDTWVSPGWTMDFTLDFAPDSEIINPIWTSPLIYQESFTRDSVGDKGVEVAVDIPAGLRRILLQYYVSGHCTDGTDADEFVQKDNVIYVDTDVVYRYRLWRDDCRQFRPINPYCRRWSDGSWSCDYSRSGWCPGDIVKPLDLDLTDHLTPGKHTLRFVIENIRPRDDQGNFGYWRVSSRLIGWK